MEDIKGTVKIYPLPHQPVVKDLVPDLTNFYAQYASIEPWLQTTTPTPEKEWRQSHDDRKQARRALRVHPVRLLLDLMPELLVESASAFSARPRCCRPSAGCTTAATRSTGERLDNLEDPFRLYRCHTIMNCAKACPKGLNPAKAIADIKQDGRTPGVTLRNLASARPLARA